MPGATKPKRSFVLFRVIIDNELPKAALSAVAEAMSKRYASAAKSCGLRIRLSVFAPLERITGTENLLAIAVSLLRLASKWILSKLVAERSMDMSISSEAKALEANSASASSK
jgi:hypothetical protein